MHIKGVIFDMDGVILDSEKLYMRFWIEAAQSFGYNMQPEHVLGIRSLAENFASEKLKREISSDFDIVKVKKLRIKLMADYVEKNGIEAKKGIYELLDYLDEKNIKKAVATSTPMERARPNLEYINVFNRFNKVICSSMVKNGKPEPDIYLRAAEELELAPEECIALEDSPNGILSAFRAGCKTIMVPDLTLPDEQSLPYLFDTAIDLTKVIDIINRIENFG